MENKINEFLSYPKSYNGLKLILFDKESQDILSTFINRSRFLNNNFFLFDLLSNRDRKPMSHIMATVVLKPSNLRLLIEELKNPFYKFYTIFFTSEITIEELQSIANSDKYNVIYELKELNIEFYRIDRNFYRINNIDIFLLNFSGYPIVKFNRNVDLIVDLVVDFHYSIANK